MADDTNPIVDRMSELGHRLIASPGRWPPAPGDTLRAGYPPTDTAVESPPARPESVMSNTDRFLAQMRVERALLNLRRRTAGREPSRAERRLQDHYERQLRDLDPESETP